MAGKKEVKDKAEQLLDNFDFHGMSKEKIPGTDGLIKQLTSRILQKALQAEMDEHLGYEKNSNTGITAGTAETATHRNQ